MLNINFHPFPNLGSERLHLRQLKMSDDNDIFFLRSEESINKYLQDFRHDTIEQSRKFITKIINGIENSEWIFWVITLKDSDKLIGTICLWNISKENYKAETGYVLHPHSQGKGIMHEGLSKVIEFGFGNMKLKTIEAYTHRGNESSTKLLEKHNFKRLLPSENANNNNEIIFSLAKSDLIKN